MSKVIVGEIEGPASTSNKITIASGSQLDLVGSTGTVTIDASDITTGALSSTLTYPGRLGDLEDLPGTGGFPPTALVWRETTSTDDTAVSQISTSAPYSYWRKLDNESDPHGIISLASDAITITNAGKYAITFNSACHFRALYTVTQLYNFSTSTILANSGGGFTSATDTAGGVSPTGFFVGTLAAGTVLRVYSLSTADNTYYWSAVGPPRIFSSVQIQLIGT
jgi:hypothetical protein